VFPSPIEVELGFDTPVIRNGRSSVNIHDRRVIDSVLF
jgi:hypothetical protein